MGESSLDQGGPPNLGPARLGLISAPNAGGGIAGVGNTFVFSTQAKPASMRVSSISEAEMARSRAV
jgi:hypothetical protein